MTLPELWRESDIENLTVVYEDRTVSYELVETDSGEDRMPKLINNSYIDYGTDGIDYYSGWEQIAQGDPDEENRLPVAFRTEQANGDEYVEIVYHNRTEIYREKKVYPKGSQARIYEEMSREDYENYYRNNGFRQVAP